VTYIKRVEVAWDVVVVLTSIGMRMKEVVKRWRRKNSAGLKHVLGVNCPILTDIWDLVLLKILWKYGAFSLLYSNDI